VGYAKHQSVQIEVFYMRPIAILVGKPVTRDSRLRVIFAFVTGLVSMLQINAKLFAQAADHGTQVTSPTFEAASVKPSEPGNLRGSTFEFLPGGGLRIRNGTLRAILETAYDIREFQIIGGPAWVNSERYDILARSADGPGVADSQDNIKAVRLRLQALLAQRFKLEVHREIRDIPEYALELVDCNSESGSRVSYTTAHGF
jgi:hypothetical protein